VSATGPRRRRYRKRRAAPPREAPARVKFTDRRGAARGAEGCISSFGPRGRAVARVGLGYKPVAE
jgi:hypothetical protein